MTSTAISVVVCTYNRCESLRDTLRALSQQSLAHGLSMEIVVVDNNSSDRTKAVIEEAVSVSSWPLRYLFEANQGISYARNRGIQEARGEYLFFTDDDVLPESNWAQVLYDAFVGYGADSVGGKVLPKWLETPPPWLVSERLRRQVWGTLALLDRGSQVIEAKAEDKNFLYGANMAFRKELFSKLGMFQTDLGAIGSSLLRGDDTEMIGRVLKAGKKVVYIPDAVVYHKVGPERMRKEYFRRWKFSGGRSLARLSAQRFQAWVLRECLESGAGALWAYGRRDFEVGLQKEWSFWVQLGRLIGYWEGLWKKPRLSA